MIVCYPRVDYYVHNDCRMNSSFYIMYYLFAYNIIPPQYLYIDRAKCLYFICSDVDLGITLLVAVDALYPVEFFHRGFHKNNDNISTIKGHNKI